MHSDPSASGGRAGGDSDTGGGREERPDTAILVLSAHVDIEHGVELLASGHRIGYLLKSRITDVTGFIETIESIARVVGHRRTGLSGHHLSGGPLIP